MENLQNYNPGNPADMFPAKQEHSHAELHQYVNDVSSRLKVIEDRQQNLRRKNQLTEQNMLNMSKKLSVDIKALSEELHETKKELDEILEKLLLFMKEVDKCAKKEDVRMLEKYLEFWNPINFLTREDAEKLLQDSMRKDQES